MRQNTNIQGSDANARFLSEKWGFAGIPTHLSHLDALAYDQLPGETDSRCVCTYVCMPNQRVSGRKSNCLKAEFSGNGGTEFNADTQHNQKQSVIIEIGQSTVAELEENAMVRESLLLNRNPQLVDGKDSKLEWYFSPVKMAAPWVRMLGAIIVMRIMVRHIAEAGPRVKGEGDL